MAWAEESLGSAVRDVQPLRGGLTPTMLALTDASGTRSVLRLMTEEPWRSHGKDLPTREQAAQRALVGTPVPAPESIALDADGTRAGVSAHLMSGLDGERNDVLTSVEVAAMATMLATVHDVRPAQPFRSYQSWAWEEAPERYWLVLDAVGFLPPPGKEPMFGSPARLAGLDAWVSELISWPGI